MTSSLKVWINLGRTQGIQPNIFLQILKMDFLEEFCLGHDWDGRLSSWKATSSIVLSIEWKQVYNQHFYIALDWQLDHWSCSWPGCESLMVSGWIKNQDPNQPQREMTSPSRSQKSQHVLWQPVTSLIDSSIATEISFSQFSWCSQSSWDLGHFSIHCFPFIFFLFPYSKYKTQCAARPHYYRLNISA